MVNYYFEDEMHFLLECPKFKENRNEFLEHLNDKSPAIKLLKGEDLLIFLMLAEGEICSCSTDPSVVCTTLASHG